MAAATPSERAPRPVQIPPNTLQGDFTAPASGLGIVIFAHGSGSSRLSPRNRYVADRLSAAGLGTLLFDLLRPEEAEDRQNVFDIDLLGHRLMEATIWLDMQPGMHRLPIGYFGASTGAAAALVAAAEVARPIQAVVSRGGRPDLASRVLAAIGAPTLLLVGSEDEAVIGLNQMAFERLQGEKRMELIEGATHLFEEPGTLDAVVEKATAWFLDHLRVERIGS